MGITETLATSEQLSNSVFTTYTLQSRLFLRGELVNLLHIAETLRFLR